MVVVYANNMLKVYENNKKTQLPPTNTEELFSLNLTAEGVCDDARDIVMLEAA
jgi:hypothetical protein